MATYCVRCGYRCSLLKSLPLQGSTICDDCLEELGFPVTLKLKEKYRSMGATYEMLLAESRLNDPNILDKKPGPRLDNDFQQPQPTPTVRTISQILDEDYLVENPGIKLTRLEKCYYKGTLTLSVKTKQKVVTGGGGYTGVSFNLGFGLRYTIGGREPVKTKVKDVKQSSSADLYLTSDVMAIVINKKRHDFPYGFIDDISWGLKSFEFTSGDETATLSTKILPIDKIKRIYYLINLKREEDELLYRSREAAKPKTNKRTNSKKKAESEEKDPITLIREYKKLLDDGIISQEEFDAKKTELLKL